MTKIEMKPCFSEVTTLTATFAEDVAACAGAGWPALEVWLTKLESHLQTHSAGETKELLAANRIALAAASYQGGLLLSQGEARQAHFDHYKRRLSLCEAFGIPTLLIAADFVQRPDATALERAIVSLKQAAQWADGFGIRLALEFRGTDAFCSCLDTALLMVEQCGAANVGVNLDVFHYYKGPSKAEDLEKLNLRNLAFVQFADVAGIPRELATDSDRVMPGEGDFQLKPIVERLNSIGYSGYISLELMNAILWQIKPAQVAELGLAALRRFVPVS
jgi:2-keto-myo-inositol isomerase